MFAYLDDWLVMAPSEAESRAATAKVRRTLKKAGFILNEEKFKLILTHSIEWLGWTWRTTDMTISSSGEGGTSEGESDSFLSSDSSVKISGRILGRVPQLGDYRRPNRADQAQRGHPIAEDPSQDI